MGSCCCCFFSRTLAGCDCRLRLGRIGKYDITRIEQIFSRLDKDKNGVLEKQDVQDLLSLQKRRMAGMEGAGEGAESADGAAPASPTSTEGGGQDEPAAVTTPNPTASET